MNMNKIKVGAKIKVNAENPTTAHTLVRCASCRETEVLRIKVD
jgi:TusA-related sulfurtransferase